MFYAYVDFVCLFMCAWQVWMQGALSGLSPVAQKVAQAQYIVENLVGARTLKEFSAVLDRYELTCRRNI